MSAFWLTGWLLYRSIISGERYMGVVFLWIWNQRISIGYMPKCVRLWVNQLAMFISIYTVCLGSVSGLYHIDQPETMFLCSYLC